MTTQAEKAQKIKQFNEQKQLNAQGATESETTKTNKEKIEADKVRRDEEVKAEQERLKASKANGETPEEPEDQTQETLNLLTDSVSYMVDNMNQKINPAKQWLAAQPTPGGIAAILIFIAFMMLAIIPVNSLGQTRLYLFWNTLVGRTHMKYRETAVVGGSTTLQTGTTPGAQYNVNLSTGASTPATNGTLATDVPLSFQHLNIFGSTEA